MKAPNPTAWLWWLALLIAAGAAAMVYGFSQDVGNPDAAQSIRTVIMLAVIGSGICIIAATSRWWLHR